MKKRISTKKLGRSTTARRALLRALVKALVENGAISTTQAKAKFIQRNVDKLVNLIKRGDLSSIRRTYSIVGNNRIVIEKIKKEVVPLFEKKSSGFTKITNLPARKGDMAKIVRIEWSEKKVISDKKKVKGNKVGKAVKENKSIEVSGKIKN